MTDTERLDFLDLAGFSVRCNWKNTGFAGGVKWDVFQYAADPIKSFPGDSLREAIDKAMARS
jgi:hypothetical protein